MIKSKFPQLDQLTHEEILEFVKRELVKPLFEKESPVNYGPMIIPLINSIDHGRYKIYDTETHVVVPIVDDEWFPIETAPMVKVKSNVIDGMLIDVFDNKPLFLYGKISGELNGVAENSEPIIAVGYWYKRQWIRAGTVDYVVVIHATHWRPMFKGPKT